MATNNAINLNSSGIVSYDAAGAFSALANPLTVANGGSTVASNTAYAVLCGGTTTTNPIQSIASVGTAAQILTSNGAGALPTFQTFSATSLGYVLRMVTKSMSPLDSTTYFFGATITGTTFTASGTAITRLYCPVAGTINRAYGSISVAGTLGGAQNVTIAVRLNNTTDTNITTTLQLTAADNPFSNAALGIAVVAGDYVEFKMVTPAFSPNPTTCYFSCSLTIG